MLSALRKTFTNLKVINDIRQAPALFHTTSLLLRYEIDDINALKSIEENLFENSDRQSSFVSKKHLLRKVHKDSHVNKKKEINNRHRDANTNEKVIKTLAPYPPTKPLNKAPKELIIDEDIGFRYTKLQRNDKIFQQMMLQVKSKKLRNVKHQLLLEGRRLIIDAIQCGLPLTHLIFSDIEQLKLVAKYAPKDVTCYKVSQGDLSFWSTLTTCPGLIAIFEKPVDMTPIWQQKDRLPIIVICDQVREPNNVGGIIRGCASLPVEKVILTKGCADPWDTKALRGGAGAQFLVPTVGPMHWDSIHSILPQSYDVFIAENNPQNAKKILGGVEMDMRFVPYSDIPKSKSCVVVVGGETEGVSKEAYELLKYNPNGYCVHIPLADGIDSLNTSTALAIILFEIRKQMTQHTAAEERNANAA